MMKSLLVMTFFLSLNAMAQMEPVPNFEAELRAIENDQLKLEELQMNRADAVTDVISDEISTGQAATLRDQNKSDDSDLDAIRDSHKTEKVSAEKKRRVRSR